MWKPPERIKHTTRPDPWPSADDAARAKLFSPLTYRALNLTSRTWVPAMVPWRATDDGHVTQDNIDWYARFAKGRPGAIVVEATGIRDVPSGPLLRIGHDRYIDGLARIADAVRAASGGQTRLFIQLIDFLSIKRRPEPAKFFERFLVVSDGHRAALGAETWSEGEVRHVLAAQTPEQLQSILTPRELDSLRNGARERVTDTHIDHIRDLPQVLPELFAAAACRAVKAGFDGVELHYAHAYTMASFLSATNTREDGYGGTRNNRLRLPLEITAAVRAEIGPDVPLGCRFLADECIDGGSGVDDAATFATRFAEAGMDFLSLSRGGKFDDAKQPSVGDAVYPYTGRSGYECMPGFISDQLGPFGRNFEATARIRSAVRYAGFATPIIAAGGIHSFAQAETLLADGKADIAAFARQALADPDWFEKVRTGHGASVRVCEYTNYCEGLDQKHKQVTCQLWDRETLDEPGCAKSRDGRRRLTAPLWRMGD